tara:strand:- start:329 stop:559 length:231 start_codon:yes stop_codon:yes gene_type:complete
VKKQLFDKGIISPLIKFTNDLFEIENEILKPRKKQTPEQIIVFADYKIEWNPEYSNQKILAAQKHKNKELTLAELQ